MQCRLPKKQTTISTVDVALSGTFNNKHGYVTIDDTQYTSAQTLKVAKGTIVTVYCWSAMSNLKDKAYINLNGAKVAKGTSSAGAVYTFAVTDNCAITVTTTNYSYADITMPA